MTRTRIDFSERKRSAEDTALWMKADVHKAQNAGESMVMMKVKDMVEVLAYIDAMKHRDRVEFGGQHLGFARPDDVLRLLRQETRGFVVMVKKGEKYNLPVSFTGEIPAIPETVPALPKKAVEMDEDNIPLGEPVTDEAC